MLKIRAVLLVAAIGALAGVPCRADLLVGTQATDNVQLLYLGTPIYTFAPVTQTIGNGITDFTTAYPGVNAVTAEFNITPTGDTLTFTDQVSLGAPALGWTATFTDPVFQNFNLTLQPGGSLTGINLVQNGNTLTFSWAGGPTNLSLPVQSYSASYSMVDPPPPASDPSAPEPATTQFAVFGLGAIGALALRRRSAFRQS